MSSGNRQKASKLVMPFANHDEYFASCAADVQPLLRAIQAKVEAVVPEATRCISYQMPAFKAKKVFFYFAAFKKHIGIYPPVKDDNTLLSELAPYRGPKGNLSFPLNQALPMALIERVVLALYAQYR